MIPVTLQPEPINFDKNVRQKGLADLAKKGISLTGPVPPKTKITPHWRACLDDLYRSYDGCCAYLGVSFERTTGAGSVDHFIAKSQLAGKAYEWDNYRLACSVMNSRKRAFDDVLDPFSIGPGWFHLELFSGRVFPNPSLTTPIKQEVQATIDRLKLDDPGNREMRARHFLEYISHEYTDSFLERRSPFVWYEAHRQGLTI